MSPPSWRGSAAPRAPAGAEGGHPVRGPARHDRHPRSRRSAGPARPGHSPGRLRRRPAPLGDRRPRLPPGGRPQRRLDRIFRRRPAADARGKTGWREVEIGRGSSDATCPVAALETWLKFARISVGPVFRRVVGGKVGAERLTDRHVARLVKHAALAAGVRGDLTEGERERKFSGRFAARRPRLLGRGRRALRAKAARARLRGNDPALPAPPRPLPGQSDQGGGLVSAESGPRRHIPLPCPAPREKLPPAAGTGFAERLWTQNR